MSGLIVSKLHFAEACLLRAALLIVGFAATTLWTASLGAQTTTREQGASAQTPIMAQWEIAAGGKMAFDVASVKQDKLDARPVSNVKLNNARQAYPPNGGTFSARNYPLIEYIAFAYKLTDQQAFILLPSLPGWVMTDRFDIEAKSDNPSPTKDQMRLMLQSLIEDRFQLIRHRETRQLPVLALVPAKPGKTGPQLRLHAADSPCPATEAVSPSAAPIETILRTFPPNCNHSRDIRIPGGWRLAGRNVNMQDVADALNGEGEGRGDRIFTDETGLKGTFDFVVDFSEDSEQMAGDNGSKAGAEISLPPLQSAVADQLGLKFVKKTAPTDCFIVSHVERPSAN
jgi:uncharacterized protein (TIGR03435 family)